MPKEWTPITRIELLLKLRFNTKSATAKHLGLSKPGLDAYLLKPSKLFRYVDTLASELKLTVCDFAEVLTEGKLEK